MNSIKSITKSTKILCFGDSITLGEGDSQNGGWVDTLKRAYLNNSNSIKSNVVSVFNLGIGSDTSDGLLARCSSEFQRRVYKQDAAIVIIAFGINDVAIKKNKNTVPIDYFRRNILQSIEKIRSSNLQIILLNILPVSTYIDGKVNGHEKLVFNRDVELFNAELQGLAFEFCCEYIDVFWHFKQRIVETLLCEDGVHPNTEGHALIYQTVQQKLDQLKVGKM